MPEISRFFGIVILMYAEPMSPHHRPHCHAQYGGDVAIIAIDAVEVIAGFLPRRQLRLVHAWAEIHRTELLDAWRCLQEGRPPRRIAPLR